MSGTEVDPAVASRVARSILQKNVGIRKGETITVEGWTHSLPWATALTREARRLGAFPMLLYEEEDDYWDAVDHKEEKVLGATPPHEFAALGKTDVYLHMWGPGDRVRLNALPEKRMESLLGWNMPWYDSAHKAKVRGARLELGRVYPTLAKAYGVDEGEWQQQIVDATLVDPAELARSARPIIAALEKGRSVRIHDDHGTDLTLGLAQRKTTANLGRPTPKSKSKFSAVLFGLPAGAIRVALDEKTADGTIVSNRTSYYDDGKASGARFDFKAGRLVDANFDTGGERFQDPFKKAGKGRDQPGILSIGLNPALHDTPQVEDIEKGAIMVAVGGNKHLGGKNGADFFGWAINAGARLEIDGRDLTP